MQDITSSPVSRLDASAAAVTVASGFENAPSVTPIDQFGPESPHPVTQRERIATIDIVRGVALMGILVMNIGAFSGPIQMYVNPLSVGNHRTLNLAAWIVRWILFEGKMRAAFSILFGAGVILMTERAEHRGSRNIADVFCRRNMWLVLFGVLHFYFIWGGDILYYYGLTALLFLYPCRNLRYRTLFIAGSAVLLLGWGPMPIQIWMDCVNATPESRHRRSKLPDRNSPSSSRTPSRSGTKPWKGARRYAKTT